MPTIRFIIVVLALLLISPAVSGAQGLAKLEKQLVESYKKIRNWRTEGMDEIDSLPAANHAFTHQLLQVLQKDSTTIDYPFHALTNDRCVSNEGVFIATSSDGQLRIYSWWTMTGGSSVEWCEVIYQYRGAHGVQLEYYQSEQDGDAAFVAPAIYTVPSSTGVFYLIDKSPGWFENQEVCAIRIEGDKLSQNIKPFKTGSGLKNSIHFTYDFGSVVDRPERPVKLVAYDEVSKLLRLSLVDKDQKVTKKFIDYRFNGSVFERVKK